MFARPSPLCLNLLLVGGCSGAPGIDESSESSDSSTSNNAQSESDSVGADEDDTRAGTDLPPDLPPELPSRIAVTADFMAQTLSVLDAEILLGASEPDWSADELIVSTVDLADWSPGPLEIEFVPGTREVIVAVGPGFFGGIVGGLIEAGTVAQQGALVHVDLISGEVLASLEREFPPMGIALTPDASTILVADWGHEDIRGETISFIDLDSFTQTSELVVGSGPEQIDLNVAGSMAIVNCAGEGTVRIFSLDDPEGTLSVPLELSGDPSWVQFIDGSDLAMVTNSADPANWSVVDLSDPVNPLVREHGESISGFPYALAPYAQDEFIFTSMTFDRFEWHRVNVANVPSTLEETRSYLGITVFPLGIVVDADTDLLIAPLAGVSALGVFDLNAKDDVYRQIPWEGIPGPTYVILESP